MPRRVPPQHGGLFGDAAVADPSRNETKQPAYTVNIDGGSRGTPGPAAYGVVIRDPRGEIVARLKKYIGRATNNVAEYYGLIAALDYAQSHGIRALRIESDSELLVNQMRGRYKVKSVDLKPLFERARKMAHAFESFRIEHVYRERNAEADRLANQALDETSGTTSRPGQARPENRDAGSDARGANSGVRIRARFRSGILYPLEDLDLPDGAEVDILVRPGKKP